MEGSVDEFESDKENEGCNKSSDTPNFKDKSSNQQSKSGRKIFKIIGLKYNHNLPLNFTGDSEAISSFNLDTAKQESVNCTNTSIIGTYISAKKEVD